MFAAYGKAIAAVIAAALTAAQLALAGDNHITEVEVVQIAIAAAFAVGVWLIPLAPQYRWTKTALAVILAVLQALVTVVVGGIAVGEWIVLALAAGGVIGVAAAPAESNNGVSNRVATR
jgi:hypothetical protein